MISHPGRITIKQVVREAGRSIQTVSRVINRRPAVAPETRQLVLGVIARLGSQPSEPARSLIDQRSATLAVVAPGLKYIGPSRTLHGISAGAEELGYAILLKELASFSLDHVQPLLKFFLARYVDGILWAVPEIGNNRASRRRVRFHSHQGSFDRSGSYASRLGVFEWETNTKRCLDHLDEVWMESGSCGRYVNK